MYSRAEPALSLEEIRSLTLSGAEFHPGENGTSLIRWPEAQLTLFPPMPEEKLPLTGFVVQRSAGAGNDWNQHPSRGESGHRLPR